MDHRVDTDASAGKVVDGKKVCFVSFPAGQNKEQWDLLIGQGEVNYACVWTSKDEGKSPAYSQWYKQWCLNVDVRKYIH